MPAIISLFSIFISFHIHSGKTRFSLFLRFGPCTCSSNFPSLLHIKAQDAEGPRIKGRKYKQEFKGEKKKAKIQISSYTRTSLLLSINSRFSTGRCCSRISLPHTSIIYYNCIILTTKSTILLSPHPTEPNTMKVPEWFSFYFFVSHISLYNITGIHDYVPDFHGEKLDVHCISKKRSPSSTICWLDPFILAIITVSCNQLYIPLSISQHES